jgi:hypothetical protein
MGVVVICVRDPDASNDFTVIGGEVRVIDLDLGRADLSDREEFEDWFDGHMTEVQELRAEGEDEAAAALESALGEVRGNFGHPEPEPVAS